MTADLKRHALTNLGDRGLTPAAAARASYISVRQLHRLFAREGLSFAAWVHEQRLRRCRDDLTDRSLAHLAIAEVATRWGFRSAAHFSRAFAARYGVTPSEFRQVGLPSVPGSFHSAAAAAAGSGLGGPAGSQSPSDRR